MVILITGVSSGFGKAMAEELVRQGHTVYGTVRKQYQEIEGVHHLYADVREESSIEAAMQQISEEGKALDVFINNAGIGIGGPLEFTTLEEAQQQMDVNFMGMLRWFKYVVPMMRKQQHGKIIAVSSIGGLMGLPFQGLYSASKFAIEGYCEALRLEVAQHHIDVITLEPGDFATHFTQARKKVPMEEALAAYPSYQSSIQSIENDEQGGLKPEQLARKVAKIIKKKHPAYHYVIASPVQYLSTILKRLLPARWFAPILKSYYKL